MRLRILLCLLVFGLWGHTSVARDILSPCALTAQWPLGMSEHTLITKGQPRRYLVYLPHHITSEPELPLVLSFHGFASTPEQNVTWSHMEKIAEQHGFIAVFPAAEGQPASWNAGSNLISNGDSDDVRFISDLLDYVEQPLCVDTQRVYAVGFSAGGGLVARLACEMPQRFAAVGMVSGAMGSLPETCASLAMPIMMFHGDADAVVPYVGRWGFVAASTAAADWAQHNHCLVVPVPLLRHDDIEPVVFGGCDDNATVIFYTVHGGGHTWPGGQTQTSALAGHTSTTIDAGEAFWVFFSQYTRTPLTAPTQYVLRQPRDREVLSKTGEPRFLR